MYQIIEKLFSPEFVLIFVAALPISELRGAIPLGIAGYGFHPIKALLLAFIGNLLPVPLLLFFLNYLLIPLRKIYFLDMFFKWWFSSVKKRSKLVERYGMIGLTAVVAIPFPFTGAWTGCVASFLFQIKFKRAFPAIVLGIIIAGVIVTISTIGVKGIFDMF